MAMVALKLKCEKCGYSIPLTMQEHRSSEKIKCPRCLNMCSISADEEETIIEE